MNVKTPTATAFVYGTTVADLPDDNGAKLDVTNLLFALKQASSSNYALLWKVLNPASIVEHYKRVTFKAAPSEIHQ